MTESDFHAFFDAALHAMSDGNDVPPRLVCQLGNQVLAVHCHSDELWARLSPAISHWEEPEWNAGVDASPDFVIWAGTHSSMSAPLQAPNWMGTKFTEAGVPLDADGKPSRFDLRFQPWQRMIHAHRDRVGLFWVAHHDDLPWWEATFPFRILLHWWSRGSTFQLMHSAAVSADSESAWLIPGPSGSGKSTTVASLLESGFSSQGDDYVLVDTSENPLVYPLYNSIKLTWEAVSDYFEHLRPKLRLPSPDAKAMTRLTDLGALAGPMPLKGVLVPALPEDDTPEGHLLPFEAINAAEALLAIAPTTLHHLPEGRSESWSKISQMLRRLPVYKWRLSSSLQRNVWRFPLAATDHVMRVAVVMPAYNPGPEIFRAWESLRSQDWTRAAMLLMLVDDASTDADAVNRMLKLKSDYPRHVIYIRLAENKGPAAARNAGIARAKMENADWIAFCDHDDEWPEDKWLRQASHAFRHPHLQVVGGLVKYHVAADLEDPIDKYLDDEKHVSHVHLGAILVRSETFEQVGVFDEEMRFSEDFDWWNRVREGDIPYQILSQTMLHYHFHGSNSVAGKSAESLGVLDALARSIKRRRETQRGQAPKMLSSLRDDDRAWQFDVVVPVHNGLKFLPGLLDCIANQALKPKVVCFVNDASTDGSGTWLDAHVPDALGGAGRVIHLEKNLGVAGARNVGWKACKSPWVALLDQDDCWLPEKMKAQMEHLKSNPQAQWSTVWCRPVLAKGFHWPADWSPSMKIPHKCNVPSGWVVSRTALHALNGFDESYRLGDDTEIAGRLQDRFGAVSVCPSVLVERYFGLHNNSHKKEPMKAEMMSILRDRIQRKQDGRIDTRHLVYVVISAFNSERFLDETMRAIENQTHRDWVGCVVNDGSQDRTLDIARVHAQTDLRWRVLDQENGGAPSAINLALSKMPSDVHSVAFCDHDDFWLPTRLEAQVRRKKTSSPDELWCIGSLVEEFEDFQRPGVARHRARPGNHRAVLRSNVLMSSALVSRLGEMDLDQRFADFIEWIAPALRQGLVFEYVDEVLVRRRIHEDNMTAEANHEAYLKMIHRHLRSGRHADNSSDAPQ